MTRILIILMLLLAGLPRVGVGMIGGTAGHDCTEKLCQPVGQPAVIVPSGCCDALAPALAPALAVVADMVDMDQYCPMSGGDCRCGVSPEDGTPNPKAPLQRSEIQITLGLTKALVEISCWTTPSPSSHGVPANLVDGLASLRTNNETQAILGVWRT